MVTKTEENVETQAGDGKLPKSVYVVAQEIKMVKALAGNSPLERDKQLRKLRKWLNIRSNSTFEFTDEDFMRLWKGLHYCMWMSDKPLVQEALAEDLGSLLYCFAKPTISVQFFRAFLRTMGDEWFGIDQWRMDKFLMLVRRMLRHMFYVLKKDSWNRATVKALTLVVEEMLLRKETCVGLPIHFTNIYLEELAKVSDGEITGEDVVALLKPFVKFLAIQKEVEVLKHIQHNVFHHLLYQTERGREYTEKFNAWKEMGFPTEHIDELEMVEANSEESDADSEKDEPEEPIQKSLDPRAGCVDVVMPVLPVDASGMVKTLENIHFKEFTNVRSRKFMRGIIERYKKFEAGEFPLGVKQMPKLKMEPMKKVVEKKMVDADKLDEELYSTSRQLKKLSKKKRKRLLQSINFDDENFTEEDFEKIIRKSLPLKKRKLSDGCDEWKEEDILPSKPQEEKVKTKSDKLNLVAKKDKVKKNTMKIKEKQKLKQKIKKTIQKPSLFVESSAESSKVIGNCVTSTPSEWAKPLENGEIEYFIPSRKKKLKEANESLGKKITTPSTATPQKNLLLNPFAKLKKSRKSDANVTPDMRKSLLLGKAAKKALNQTAPNLANPPSTEKKVKIVLHKNMSQKPSEYIKQVKSSPQLPFDSDKKPTKSLLKPNLMPSPINPFYKKKIGLKLNDSL